MSFLRTASLESNFSGSYKKKSVAVLENSYAFLYYLSNIPAV